MKSLTLKMLARVATIVALMVANCAFGQSSSSVSQDQLIWVNSWGASQQVPEAQNALAPDDLRDSTLRELFHLSLGGPMLRVHISNAFGKEALRVTSVHIARPVSTASPQIVPETDRVVTFAGKPEVLIPPGAEFVSDPVAYAVPALADVAVSFHLSEPPTVETGHPGSRATSYYVHGDVAGAANFVDAARVDHWYIVSGIDVGGSGCWVRRGSGRLDHGRPWRNDERK